MPTLQDDLVEQETMLQDALERKRNFLTVVNKEIKLAQDQIAKIVQDINSGQSRLDLK